MPDIECARCGYDGTLYLQADETWLCEDCEKEPAADA